MAGLLGVHRNTIWNWEHNRVPIPEKQALLAFKSIAFDRQNQALARERRSNTNWQLPAITAEQ